MAQQACPYAWETTTTLLSYAKQQIEATRAICILRIENSSAPQIDAHPEEKAPKNSKPYPDLSIGQKHEDRKRYLHTRQIYSK